MAKHVTAGEKFRFSARTYNELNELIEKDRLGGLSMQTNVSRVNNDYVLVKNSSGADVGRFGILGIAGILFDPQTALPAFTSRPVFTGEIPAESHGGRFLICAEPIRNGSIGRAWAEGVVITRVLVQDSSHYYASVKPDDTTQLVTHIQGLCCLLYKEAGTGTKWAVVRLGAGNPNPVRTAYCKTAAPEGSTIVCYLDEDGTGQEVTVYCDISGGSDLNLALRRLENGDRLKVHYNPQTSHWESLEGFQASKDCE